MEDNANRYELTSHGIRVSPHSGEWTAYYRIGDEWELVLIAFAHGKPPGILTVAIRTYEDLKRKLESLPAIADADWTE